MRKTLVVDMDVHDDHAYRGVARRRRERRLRAFLRREKLSLSMHMATVSHHSWHRAGRADASTQTLTYTDAATCAATAAPEYVAPALVVEYIAPVPTGFLPVPSQQLPPTYTVTAVTTGVKLDTAVLVSPQFSGTAVEASAPQIVGSLPPFAEFTEPVYNQVHQEQIVAGEMTQNIIENPAVQEQVIVQEIPPVVERIQEQIVETINVTCNQIPSSSSTSTSKDRLGALTGMLDSCLEQLTPLAGLSEEIERIEKLTKRLLETPLPEPPMVEPDRTSAKRRRRTRYTELPGIVENAVYLAPSAWPPTRRT